MADYFPSAGKPAFTSRGKIAGPRHPPLRFGPSLRSGAGPVRPPPFVAMKAAMGAADPTKESHHDDRTRRHRLRAAAHLIPDRSRPRRTPALRLSPLPGRARSEAAARSRKPSPAPSPTSSTPSSSTLADTRLEPDLEDLLWSTVNLFHRAVDRIERELDDNEQAQRRSQKEQDGSEIRSVELERLTAEGMTLIERRNSLGVLPRPGRRPVRAPHRLGLAAARRIDGQPSHPDLGHDRQPRLPRRQAPGRNRGAAARRPQDRLHRRARLQRSSR